MKKLNGYRPTHRNKWVLIREKILTLQELALWEFYADIVDFDKKHEKFGLFEVDFVDIASLFNCSSNTIRNWHNKLVLLQLIKRARKGFYELVSVERFINPSKWNGKAHEFTEKEKDQPIEIILQSFGLDFQTVKEKIQSSEKKKELKTDDKSQIDSIAIGSSKDEYKLPSSDSKDYTKIKEEMGFKMLTEEDMKWIDENITERANVPT